MSYSTEVEKTIVDCDENELECIFEFLDITYEDCTSDLDSDIKYSICSEKTNQCFTYSAATKNNVLKGSLLNLLYKNPEVYERKLIDFFLNTEEEFENP